MYSNKLTTPVMAITIVLFSRISIAEVLFEDNFETGDLTKTSNGVFWANGAYTRVVDSGPSISGDYSLQFRYEAGKHWAEQRFDLGGKYPEIWIKWSIYIPANFGKTGSRNNKLMYVDSRKTDETNNVNMYTGFEHWDNTRIGIQQALQDSRSIGWIWPSPDFNFVDSEADKGKWHTFVFHLKKSDSEDAKNGIIQVWKNGELRADFQGLDNYSPGYNHYETGYLMGYANSTYSDTESVYFYIDDVVFSTTPIGTPKPKSVTHLNVE